MKISTRLMLAVFVPALMALVICIMLVFSYQDVRTMQENGDTVRQIRTSITELNHIVFSYILYSEERPKQQFSVEHDSLTRLISSAHLKNSDQQRLLDNIRLSNEAMEDLFRQLVSNREVDSQARESTLKVAEDPLTGLLLLTAYEADNDASTLRRLVDSGVKTTEARTTALIFLVMVLASVPLTIVMIRTRRSIISSLSNLMEGAAIIGSGKLDFRIDDKRSDEIGELSRAFNRMTASLKDVTASKLELEKEITEREKAEESLEETQAYLNNLLDYANAPIIVWDASFTITRFNHAFERLTGLSAEDVIGKRLDILFPEGTRELSMAYVGRTQTGERFETVEIPIIRTDGLTRTVLWNSATLFTSDGSALVATIAQGQDITERKAAEAEVLLNEARLEGLLKISQSGEKNVPEILDFATEEAIKLTGSKIGYIYYYDEERKEFVLNSWSREVAAECKIREPQTVYQLEKTGIWGEVVRQRKPIMLNDFQSPHPLKKGYPKGHSELYRFLTVPLFSGDKIVAVIGVANKSTDYDESDVRQLRVLMDSVWKIVDLRKAEDAAHQQNRVVKAMNEVFYSALTSNNEEELGRKCLAIAERLTQSKFGFIDEINAQGRLAGVATSDPGWELCRISQPAGHKAAMAELKVHGIYGRVFIDGKSLITNEPKSHPDSIGLPEGHPPLTSFLGVPLKLGGKTIGVIGLGNREGGYHEEEQTALEALSAAIVEVLMRKRGENDIIRLNTELGRNISYLEAANKELEAFSYSVSHDLRAPLRAMSGFSQVMLDDYSDKLDDEGKRYLGIIASNAQKMGQLINDLLAFSRLSRASLNIVKIDIEELARQVSAEQAAGVLDRVLDFRVDELPPAYGDASMVRQVLVNLIANAIKFTRPKAGAAIQIGFRSEGSENVYYVRDNGVGFDMQYRNKLFGVFQRLHREADFEGTGVGLAIVQRIVNRHGGRAWAESVMGEGATFYFTLPGNQSS